MDIEIGRIQAIYRYPVKSMAGEALQQTQLGWYGLEGDRRFAFRRVAEKGGFPWLTAGKLPELLLYKPVRQSVSESDILPTHVITPEGKVLAIGSEELRDEITDRFGAEVELMQLKQGIFDESPISLLSLATSQKITNDAGQSADIRRFRPNIVIETKNGEPFIEDQWVGKTIVMGDAVDRPAVQITLRDIRCAMINLNPDTAQSDPAVLKTVAHLNEACAGVYGTVIHVGMLTVGQSVYLRDVAFNPVSDCLVSLIVS
ncbi:MAG: MOSC domain-containing protein [Anaerolineaceae bacterium]|nr:MOSC domain-containing protein [Anaerolineaceae bacterium]